MFEFEPFCLDTENCMKVIEEGWSKASEQDKWGNIIAKIQGPLKSFRAGVPTPSREQMKKLKI